MTFGCLLLLLVGSRVEATSVRHIPWPEIVAQADFIGVVECVTSGGIVADYKVIECWTGQHKPGEIVRLRLYVNYWGQQFQTSLVGQRFVFVAFKSQDPSDILSTSGPSGIPLWLRVIPAHYQTALLQIGRLPIECDAVNNMADLIDDNPFYHITKSSELKRMREAVMAYREGPAELVEIAVLRDALSKVMESDFIQAGIKAARSKKEPLGPITDGSFLIEAADLKRLAELDDLLRSPETTAAALRTKITSLTGDIGDYCDKLIERVDPSIPRVLALRPRVAPGPPGELKEPVAFERPLKTPDSAVDALLKTDFRDEDNSYDDMGYVRASMFAMQCAVDRRKHFLALTEAKDPYVRVTGATYLCFEDEAMGKAKLRELMKLPGNPGIWAALTLARHGDKSAMDRALDALKSPPIENRFGSGKFVQINYARQFSHLHLPERVMILLTNSAKQSGIPLPYPTTPASGRPADYRAWAYEHFRSWWENHRADLVLHDPWLSILEKQNID